MQELELAVIGLLLFVIILYISRLISKIEELLIEIVKCKKQIIKLVELYDAIKKIEEKINNWEKENGKY